MSYDMERLNKMVGLSIDIRGEDYGRIMDYDTVIRDGVEYKVFRFSSGKKVEANSLIAYMNSAIYYPDGTDYVMRNRVKYAKAKKSVPAPAFGSAIRNVASVSKHHASDSIRVNKWIEWRKNS